VRKNIYTIIFTLGLALVNSQVFALGIFKPAIEDGPPLRSVNIHQIPNAIPKVEARSKYGNPPIYEVFGKRYQVMASSQDYRERGIASWYGTKFHSKRTSSGEPYDMFAMTAAHKSLPLPTYVQVKNLENGKTIIVKVNDRGPFKDNRIIDLSYVAARKIGMTQKGTAHVEVTAIDPVEWRLAQRLPTAETNSIASTTTQTLYMQVGSFGDKANAQALADRVKHYVQQKIHIKPIRKGLKRFYRVQIGPLASHAEFLKLDQAISHLGLGTPVTIIE
jgi:rare lipoprotein A